LVERCFDVLARGADGDVARQACQLVRSNALLPQLKERWSLYFSPERPVSDKIRWVYIAHWLGILRLFPLSQLDKFIGHDQEVITKALHLWLNPRTTMLLEQSQARVHLVIGQLLDEAASFGEVGVNGLIGLASALTPFSYYPVFTGINERDSLELARLQTFAHGRRNPRGAIPSRPPSRRRAEEMQAVDKVCLKLREIAQRPLADWRSSLEPWNDSVETLRATYGERWALQQIATLATSVSERPEAPKNGVHLFDEEVDLCVRARLARLRAGNLGWWKGQLVDIKTEEQRQFWLFSAVHSAGPTTLAALSPHINLLVKECDDRAYQRLLEGVEAVSNLTWWKVDFRKSSLSVDDLPSDLDAKTVVLLGARGNSAAGATLYNRYLHEYNDDDRAVNSFCQQVLLDMVRHGRQELWPRLLEVVRKVYVHGEFVGRSRGLLVRREDILARRMPLDVAKEVAGSDSQYPVDLVVLAQRRCQQAVSENIEPLAVTARRDGWFDEELD
jgi:hypothetical protein